MRLCLVGAMVVVIAVAGCTSARGGSPTAQPGTTGSTNGDADPSTSTSPSNDQTYGAPRVANALDASKFLTEPCAVLSQTQLATFGVSRPGKPDTDSEIAKRVGPDCVWHADPEVNSTIGVGFLTGNKHGLSDTYRGRDRFDYFDETSVDGYPAVFADGIDGRASGVCNITVGISDTLTFSASEDGGRKGQGSCDRAMQVATAVIATLKASA